jgi:uncharacterized membrane protein YfcA
MGFDVDHARPVVRSGEPSEIQVVKPRPRRFLRRKPTPVITDPLFYLAAIPAVTFLGLGKGGFAGIGMVSTPLMALYLPPLQAAAVLLPILIIQDIISVWTYRRDWDVWNVRVLLAGATVGVGIAWAVAAHVTDAAVRLTVGLIGVVFVLNNWFGPTSRDARPPNLVAGLFWGAATGFTSTMAQAGAPPFQVFVLPQRLPKLTMVGTTMIVFALINAMKVAPYMALGQFSTQGLGTSAALLPLAVATNFLGIWLVRVTPTVVFYRIAYILVFVISLALLWQGSAAYWPK